MVISKLATDTNSLSKLKKLTTLDLSDNNYQMDTNILKYLAALPALKHLFLSFGLSDSGM